MPLRRAGAGEDAAPRHIMDEECLEDFAGVFSLIDREGTGQIPEAALTQALQGSGFMDLAAATAMAEEQAGPIDLNVFRDCVVQSVEAASRRSLDMLSSKRGGADRLTGLPTLGAALLGILDDLKKYAQAVKDFRLAHNTKEMSDSLQAREEMRRMREISQRQESDQHGVQEAHMMQAMEFNSAWSQNMTEFERQAREIEEACSAKQQKEYEDFQEKLRQKMGRGYKFSRDLLLMRKSIDTLANQGRYDEAHVLKTKADQLERWERMKLDNEHKMHMATKELQMRQQQEMQLEALRRRIQRGREEHKEHWLLGAQRLMQSHRNMLSDLKSKQAIENVRADVAVKLDLAASRTSGPASMGMKKNPYHATPSRVDCGTRR